MVTLDRLLSWISRRRWFAAVLVAGAATMAIPCAAQTSSASQTIQLAVNTVMKIGVSGNPQAMIISEVEPGETVAYVTDNSTNYHLVTNRDVRITAKIDGGMPTGTRLFLGMASSLGTSAGLVDLSDATDAVEVIAGIGKGREAAGTITYRFAADLTEAGIFDGVSRTVVLTVTE